MTKKNLPNIPLYIGDWQKDCAALSMSAQGAWLQIVFKMFTNGKQAVYKTSTKRLQNLWRCGKEEVKEIIDELRDENICDITVNTEDGREMYSFTCRRFVRENDLSKVRSEAVKKRKDRQIDSTNDLQKPYKSLQNTENENENESVIEINNENGKKEVSEKSKIDQEAEEWIDYLNSALGKNPGRGYKKSETNINGIRPRIREYGLEKMKKVVDLKIYESTKGQFDRKYIRPETLCRAKKCENYIQQVNDIENGITNPNTEKSNLEKIREAGKIFESFTNKRPQPNGFA